MENPLNEKGKKPLDHLKLPLFQQYNNGVHNNQLEAHNNKNINNTILGTPIPQSSLLKMDNSSEKMLDYTKVECPNEFCRENHQMIKTIMIKEHVIRIHHNKFEPKPTMFGLPSSCKSTKTPTPLSFLSSFSSHKISLCYTHHQNHFSFKSLFGLWPI